MLYAWPVTLANPPGYLAADYKCFQSNHQTACLRSELPVGHPVDERQQKLWVLGLQYTTNGVDRMPEALCGDCVTAVGYPYSHIQIISIHPM